MDPDIVAGRRRAMSLCDQMQVLNLSVDIINNGVKEICISKINSNGDAMNKSTIVRDNGTSEDFEVLTIAEVNPKCDDLDWSPGMPAVPDSRNKRRLIISPETQGNRSRKVSINDDRSPRVRSPILHVKTPGADAFTQDNFDGSRRRAMSTNIKPRNKKKPVRRLSLSDTNNKEARQRLITELLKSTVKKCCSQEVFGVEGDVKGPSDGEEEN